MEVLGRLVVIVLGYVLALCAGAATLVVAAPETSLFNPDQFLEPFDIIVRALTIMSLVLEAPILGGAALAVAAVVVGEIFRLKGWPYHVLAWGAAAVLAGTPAWLWQAGAPQGVAGEVVLVSLAAGFVAGFVYWFVAGRTA